MNSLRYFLESLVVAVLLTGASYVVGLWLGWIAALDWLEVAAVFTSYSCTYLCVRQSRWNYPVGVVSVTLLAALYFREDLLGSMAQNLYLIPTLIYGYFVWGPDAVTKPVEHVRARNVPLYLLVSLAVYGVIVYTIDRLGGQMAFYDGLILVGSILAQFLLDRKKIETWAVWIAVDVLAIYVYSQAGLALVTFQFVFFLINAFWGYYEWQKDYRNRNVPAADAGA